MQTSYLSVGDFVLPVYVCHYHKNVERLAYIESLGLAANIVREFDKEQIQAHYESWDFDAHEAERRHAMRTILPTLQFNGHLLANIDRGQITPTNQVYNAIHAQMDDAAWVERQLARPRLRIAEISLFLKHMHALRGFAQTSCEWALVMEDDVIFRDDSLATLATLLAELPVDADYVDLGGGAGLKPETAFRRLPGKQLSTYLIDPPSSRTTCAYLISKRFARAILSRPVEPLLPIDFQFNFFMAEHGAKVLWLEPTLFIHGSEFGYYGSNLR